jgi:uncharacterized protein YyaL (SSP411 family)
VEPFTSRKELISVNRIDWLEWSPEAFEKAKKEKKLVLLDIGATWCHWCHVMDEECYGNPDIIGVVNESYVPVRVESDRRPDINDRYNQGGWPSTVLLSHDGFVVHGATYLPPPALKELLKQAKDWYDQNRGRVSEAAKQMGAEALRKPSKGAPESHMLTDLTDEIIENMMQSADRTHGGFGNGAKFPQASAVSLALAHFYFKADEQMLEFAEKTLQNMSDGLLDKEEGGIFRYSVSPKWNEPHYEKNLGVNAECLLNYLDAYRVTSKKQYADIAEKIIMYVRNVLSDPEGGFYGSQDADIFDEDSLQIVMEGEAYYKLSAKERKKYGAPAIDKTIYINSSALMISALFEACHVFENEEYCEVALKSLHRLNDCVDHAKGACHYLRDGQKGWPGFLIDTVALARANLDAYETLADTDYLENGVRLMEIAGERFAALDGGFYDAIEDEKMPSATRMRHKPFHDNIVAVEVFGRLYNYTTDPAFLMKAASTLAAFEVTVKDMLSKGLGYFAAEYAFATRYASDGSTKVTIVGPVDDEQSKKLLHEAKRLYRPAKIVQLIDPEKDKPLLGLMNFPEEPLAPVAHICTQDGCAPPAKDVDEMLKVLVS